MIDVRLFTQALKLNWSQDFTFAPVEHDVLVLQFPPFPLTLQSLKHFFSAFCGLRTTCVELTVVSMGTCSKLER